MKNAHEILRLAAVAVYGHNYLAWRTLMDAMAYLRRAEESPCLS